MNAPASNNWCHCQKTPTRNPMPFDHPVMLFVHNVPAAGKRVALLLAAGRSARYRTTIARLLQRAKYSAVRGVRPARFGLDAIAAIVAIAAAVVMV
ncbi:hypothetical protein [Paraburkholderia sp. J41]|uniref:hypothetical protein n=1 Tax=Paraburkholderia sp. J41 TaxID=2805433 RepID=UPI002AC35C8E|nr:hypothetical protein [Paraburkholderia sp. J41]